MGQDRLHQKRTKLQWHVVSELVLQRLRAGWNASSVVSDDSLLPHLSSILCLFRTSISNSTVARSNELLLTTWLFAAHSFLSSTKLSPMFSSLFKASASVTD